MPSLTAVVLGATGLIGKELVQQLLLDPAFSKVRILVRRPVDFSHAKLEVEVVDFKSLDDYKSKFGQGDCIFSCIGTTSSKVKGDKAAYYKVDFDIPVAAARIGKDLGYDKYLLISTVGADAGSGNFYLKLKGEVENEIGLQKFSSYHIFRPSLLFGKRDEFRLGELFGKMVMKAFSFMLIGPLKKYRGIEAEKIATAMIQAAKSADTGSFTHHYNDMIQA